MGSTHFADEHIQKYGGDGFDDLSATTCSDLDGSMFFTIFENAGDQTTPPTGMGDEILLLSWLIVLLRTRDDAQIFYDWAYETEVTDPKAISVVCRLHMEDVVLDLRDKIGNVAEAISRRVIAVPQNQHTTTITPASLLLSTGSLSRTHEHGQAEVSD
jgi:hypothetical protein